MVLTSDDMLIIYCCLGGAVAVVLILLVVVCCRKWRREQQNRQQRNHRSAHADPLTYRSLNCDGDSASPALGGAADERRRSKMTHDSSNGAGGGDLADYLQNLVDGMEKGRAAQATAPAALHGRNSNAISKQQRRSNALEPYQGADQSLLTLGPTSSGHVGLSSSNMTPFGEGGGDERNQRWISTVVRIGPVDGDGNELTGEKITGIEKWREQVARETASINEDERTPSSFMSPGALLASEERADYDADELVDD